MMSYEETIEFLKGQSNIIADNLIDYSLVVIAHIYDKEMYEVYRDIEE